MNRDHFPIATASLAGLSLLTHLVSGGNFLPDEEVWLLGTIFWYIHYWSNVIARLCLLATASAVGADIYKRNIVTNTLSISQGKLRRYITIMLITATFCIFIRFITPGPVTSFTFFYKLSFMTSLSALVVMIAEDGGAEAKSIVSSLKKGVKKIKKK